jgi:hypothetical protein
MQLWLERTVAGWKAADDLSASTMRKVKVGKVMRAELTTPRNLAHHKKFFALLNLVWSSAGDWKSVDSLLDDLKRRMRHYETIGEWVDDETGEVKIIVKLKSISFAHMDQTQFEDFYEQALRELCAMAGGIEYDVLKQEVLNQLAAA